MAFRSADDLLLDELRAIYNAEKQVGRALTRYAKKLQNDELKQMIERRREDGDKIIEELDHVFEGMQTSKGRRKNTAIEGLLEEISQLGEEIQEPALLDAAMLGAIQKVQHYCIAAWGTARSLAETLDVREAVDAMEHALEEGKQFDEDMTRLAEEDVNPAMLHSSEEDDEDEERTRSSRSGGGQGERRGGGAQASRNGSSGRQSASSSRGGQSSGGPSSRGGQSSGRNGQQGRGGGQSASGRGGQSSSGRGGGSGGGRSVSGGRDNRRSSDRD